MDPHFMAGSAPGDGQALALQALMGTKRAAHYIYGGKSIPAKTALDLGIVSDVMPREQLLERAWEIAEYTMKRPRFSRWATHNILARPWKKLVAEDFWAAAVISDTGPSYGEGSTGNKIRSDCIT